MRIFVIAGSFVRRQVTVVVVSVKGLFSLTFVRIQR